jgi:hypothetical protein
VILLLFAFSAAAPACFATARDVAAGAVVTIEDVVAVPCEKATPRPATRYDRAQGTTVFGTAMAAGTYLGRLAPPERAMVRKGAVLTLRSAAGPVVVERQVTALQPGRSGGRLFVRDSSGEVFAAPLALEAGE